LARTSRRSRSPRRWFCYRVLILLGVAGEGYAPNQEDKERLKKLREQEKEERLNLLSDAQKVFEGKNINARTIFKEGHPAEAIIEVGCGEEFDFIVIGSRGLGGLKKAMLGSVSNAVVQQAEKCSVIVVR